MLSFFRVDTHWVAIYETNRIAPHPNYPHSLFYKSNIVLSIAASAGEVVEFPGFDDITYMQDMTDHKCYIAEVGETKQLIDSRDGKKYWVSKLADGNCWMTQNLDFDIPATLSNTTSDVSEASVKTGISGSTSLADWKMDNDKSQYHDPGDYYYDGPNNTHAQGVRCDTSTSLSECKQFSTEGDQHYHIGNYYSWPAATVGSGNSLAERGERAPLSICPSGWQLPLSGINDEGVLIVERKTFARLFESYGWKWESGALTSSLNGGTKYYAYDAPFYLVFGGYGYVGELRALGASGYYWSSTIISDVSAYELYISNIVAPALNSVQRNRYTGAAVRCVAR